MSISNEDRGICARCGGQCCQNRPGIEEPRRFIGAGLESALAEALASGDWVLERHIGVPYDAEGRSPDPDMLICYPRPATLFEKGRHTVWALPEPAACVFLAETGCRLGYDDRPRLCRELEPDICLECESTWGRREAALAWLPYQEQVKAALAISAGRRDSI